jgi:hypothetical protein
MHFLSLEKLSKTLKAVTPFAHLRKIEVIL